MMNNPINKNRLLGWVGTLVFHLLLLLLLMFSGYTRIIPAEAGGVEIMAGTIDEARGTFTPETPPPASEARPVPPSSSASEKMITQAEESVTLEREKEKKAKEQRAKEENAKRLAEEKAAREKEQRAREIQNKTSNLFGKGSAQQTSGNGGQSDGQVGSPQGNSTQGDTKGKGMGISTSGNLEGRGTQGTLPSPRYTSQSDGWIEIKVVVDPSGKVISADFGKGDLADNALREEARAAALRARFKSIGSSDNMHGTITYRFRLN